MTRYHINNKGIPDICNARVGNCPFGGSETHYHNKDSAQAAANKLSEKQYGILPNVINSQEEYDDKFKEYVNNISNSKTLVEQENWRTELSHIAREFKKQDKEKVVISDVFNNINMPDGGATISIKSNYEITVPTTGFCASPYPEYSKVFSNAKDVTLDSMMEFLKNIEDSDVDILNEEDTYMGLWNDPQTGKIYLDISKRYHTAQEARVACEQSDQLAYFDLQMLSSVDVDRNATSGQHVVS